MKKLYTATNATWWSNTEKTATDKKELTTKNPPTHQHKHPEATTPTAGNKDTNRIPTPTDTHP